GNTAVGNQALFANTEGFSNTAIGNQALKNLQGSFGSGNGNIALGWKAGENIVNGSDQICIGHPGYAEFDGGIFIGNGAVHTFCQIGCTTFSVPAVYSTDLMNATKEDVYVLSSG